MVSQAAHASHGFSFKQTCIALLVSLRLSASSCVCSKRACGHSSSCVDCLYAMQPNTTSNLCSCCLPCPLLLWCVLLASCLPIVKPGLHLADMLNSVPTCHVATIYIDYIDCWHQIQHMDFELAVQVGQKPTLLSFRAVGMPSASGSLLFSRSA